jgi:hypothetical protein
MHLSITPQPSWATSIEQDSEEKLRSMSVTSRKFPCRSFPSEPCSLLVGGTEARLHRPRRPPPEQLSQNVSLPTAFGIILDLFVR